MAIPTPTSCRLTNGDSAFLEPTSRRIREQEKQPAFRRPSGRTNEQVQKNLSAFRKTCRGAGKCPKDAEDKDRFQDKDGCPDPDNDGDGFCDDNADIQGNLAKYAAVCRGKDKCSNKPASRRAGSAFPGVFGFPPGGFYILFTQSPLGK